MDNHPSSARGVTRNLVTWNGRATARKAHKHTRLTVDEYAARVASMAVGVNFKRRRRFLAVKVNELEQDLVDGNRTIPHRRKHFLLLVERETLGNAFKAFVGKQSGEGVALFLGFFIQLDLTDTDIFFL